MIRENYYSFPYKNLLDYSELSWQTNLSIIVFHSYILGKRFNLQVGKYVMSVVLNLYSTKHSFYILQLGMALLQVV